GGLGEPCCHPNQTCSAGVCTSSQCIAKDVWAAGRIDNLPTVVHWDGAWSSQQLDTSMVTNLGRVWGISAKDVWVAGTLRDASGRALGGKVIHWTGGFGSAPAISPTVAVAGGVWASSRNDVWRVGGDSTGSATDHWDGSTWSSSHVDGWGLNG